MFERYIQQGAIDAAAKLGLKIAAEVPPGMLGGLMGKAKAFGAGQLGAGKDLMSNLRGGFGGGSSPMSGLEGPSISPEQFRGKAMGNLKTLAPTLAAGGGLYLMHRHNQQQQEQQQQQAAMAQQGGGYPPM